VAFHVVDVQPDDGSARSVPNVRSAPARRAPDFTPVLDSAQTAIIVLDDHGYLTYVNGRTLAELGMDECIIGRHVWDIFAGAEQSSFGDGYRKVVAERTAVTFEAFSERRGQWYRAHMAPLAEGVYASFENISERRAAADRLRRGEERYRLAARATNDLIWDWDLVTDTVEWNENLVERFGYRPEELGNSGDWWKAKLHPEDARETIDGVQHVIDTGGETYTQEYRFQRADGSYAPIHDRGYVVRDDSGRPIRMVGAMQDLTEARRAAVALAERERLMASIFRQAVVGILHRDLTTAELLVNDRFCEILGRSADELRALGHGELVHPDDLARSDILFDEGRRTGEPFQLEMRYVRPGGDIVWCNVHVSFVRDSDGHVASCIVVAEDISDRKAAEVELVRSRTLLQTVIDSVDDLIFVKDRAGTFVLTNRALDEGCGLLTDRRVEDHFPQELAAGYTQDDLTVMEKGETLIVDEMIPIKGYPRNFQTIKVPWIKDGVVAGIVGISRDITERLAAEENLRWSAMHDMLTGLPNRRMLQGCLRQAIAEAEANSTMVAVLQVDLDHFKYVNDSLGHDAGDALLQYVAERLRTAVVRGNTVARTGGDEFAVILRNVTSYAAAEATAAEILECLGAPQAYDGHLLDARASIGVSLYPIHGHHSEQLLKAADVALYRAKALGRGQALTFAPEMRADIQRRASMISAAGDALAGGRIFACYQPKVDLRTGAVGGFEALLRWHDLHGHVRGPGEIAAAFDDPHLAVGISDRIIAQVVSDMRRWIDDGIEFGHVAVNAAPADFRRGDFADRILGQLAKAGLPTRLFQLEVTETVFLGQGAEYVGRALKLLSAAGVHIALDDFGTGYASLRHLRDFPVDSIKLDRSFIRDMVDDGDDAAIVTSMLNLGTSIGVGVVAEGIETQAQAEHLLRIGCPYGQGFLFSKAVPAAQVPTLLVNMPRWCRLPDR
jgi:diguanylate cyclase (GGDEF)-like protein/PAS domain S-box-containing protein